MSESGESWATTDDEASLDSAEQESAGEEEKDTTPRSKDKAAFLECAQSVAAVTERLSETLDDCYLPDETCRKLHERLAAVLQEAKAVEKEVDKACLDAAPQSNAKALTRQQQRDGLGLFAMLPPELLDSIWALLDRTQLALLCRLSRAFNVSVLPALMSDVQVPVYPVEQQRRMSRNIGRLADLQLLAVKSLRIGSVDLRSAGMMLQMAPSLRKLAMTAVVGASQVAKLEMPNLERLRLVLQADVDTDNDDELLLCDGVGVFRIFSQFVPAAANLRHLGLELSFEGAVFEEEDQDLGGAIDATLDLGPLRRNRSLKSIIVAFAADGIGSGSVYLSLEESRVEESRVNTLGPLRGLFALALHDDGFSTILSSYGFINFLALSERLTRLFVSIDCNWIDEGVDWPICVNALTSLAIPADWMVAVFELTSIDAGKLASLTLVTPREHWSHSGPFVALSRLRGALDVDFAGELALDAVRSATSVRHLRVSSLVSDQRRSWSSMPTLPHALETLCAPSSLANTDLQQPSTNIAKDQLNDIFLKQPNLSLVVIDSGEGGFIRLDQPDPAGYLFRWCSKNYTETKSWNVLFGTLMAYEKDWWDD